MSSVGSSASRIGSAGVSSASGATASSATGSASSVGSSAGSAGTSSTGAAVSGPGPTIGAANVDSAAGAASASASTSGCGISTTSSVSDCRISSTQRPDAGIGPAVSSMKPPPGTTPSRRTPTMGESDWAPAMTPPTVPCRVTSIHVLDSEPSRTVSAPSITSERAVSPKTKAATRSDSTETHASFGWDS